MKATAAIVVFLLILVVVFLPIAQLVGLKRQRETRIQMIRPGNRYEVKCKRDMK